MEIYSVTIDKNKFIRKKSCIGCLPLCQRSLFKVCTISCNIGSGPGSENALYELWSIKDMILCFQISCLNLSYSTSIFPNPNSSGESGTICWTKVSRCKSSVSEFTIVKCRILPKEQKGFNRKLQGEACIYLYSPINFMDSCTFLPNEILPQCTFDPSIPGVRTNLDFNSVEHTWPSIKQLLRSLTQQLHNSFSIS